MSHLIDTFPIRGKSDTTCSLIHSCGNRLFNQHMYAAFHALQGNVSMVNGWRDEADGIDGV